MNSRLQKSGVRFLRLVHVLFQKSKILEVKKYILHHNHFKTWKFFEK